MPLSSKPERGTVLIQLILVYVSSVDDPEGLTIGNDLDVGVALKYPFGYNGYHSGSRTFDIEVVSIALTSYLLVHRFNHHNGNHDGTINYECA